jgi:hypothetical protein
MERSLRLFLASVGMMIAASPAFAQEVTFDAAKLASGVSCASTTEARVGLQAAISQSLSGTPGDVVVGLLNQLSADAATCRPVRDAAKELSTAVVDASATAASEEIAAASGAIVDATLAEADRRAASLKFKVGPPPRNMTQGREGS